MLDDFRLRMVCQKLLNSGRKFEGFEDSGNIGPILPRYLSKAADAFDTCRFLKLAVIGGLFQWKVIKPDKVSPVFLPHLLINGFNFSKVFRPFSKHKLLTTVFKDAIKWLRVFEGT